MESLFGYLLKANIVLCVLTTVYYLLLRKEKFLQMNRGILMGIFLSVLLLPLCPQILQFDIFHSQYPQSNVHDVTVINNAKVITHEITRTVFDIEMCYKIGAILYILVVVILTGRLLRQTWQITRVIHRSEKRKEDGIIYCILNESVPPFSFFNFIVLKEDSFEPSVYQQVLRHEEAHCKQLHSIDVLLSELLCILLWFNPLSLLYKKQVKLNLEFLADEQVLESGTDRRIYQLSLLQNVLGNTSFNLANSFYASKVRQRVSMMNTEPPPIKYKYKYLLLLPLVFCLYLLVASGPAAAKQVPTLLKVTIAAADPRLESAAIKRDKRTGISVSSKKGPNKTPKADVAVQKAKSKHFTDSVPDRPLKVTSLSTELPSKISVSSQSTEIQGKPLLRVQGYPLSTQQKPDNPIPTVSPQTEIKGVVPQSPNNLEPIVVQGYPTKQRIKQEK